MGKPLQSGRGRPSAAVKEAMAAVNTEEQRKVFVGEGGGGRVY